ncbi:DUF6895 family protein [Streptomyces acidiscabies]|uniref:DUF6895 family protein n=1 Tax=Streptomyces acidiscabies TaxID=42234 RepID=UPI0009521081|nr:hypothetical protein [Streptomyces acidiscabies]
MTALVAARALGWLTAHRDAFRLPADATTDADRDLTWKPLGELAQLTGRIATLHPDPDLRAEAGDLFAFAWAETREGALFADLVHREPHATYPVEIYAVFAQAGLRHPAADELTAVSGRLRSRAVALDTPTRTLGVLMAERRIGLAPHADPAADLACTWLGVRPEPWALDLRTAYGLTHDVFHVTDWGADRTALDPEAADYLRLWLPAWLDDRLAQGEWDVVAELLAVGACLPDADPYDDAWARLARAQSADGAVPEQEAFPRDSFRACYHSTLATAFAATLALFGRDSAS